MSALTPIPADTLSGFLRGGLLEVHLTESTPHVTIEPLASHAKPNHVLRTVRSSTSNGDAEEYGVVWDMDKRAPVRSDHVYEASALRAYLMGKQPRASVAPGTYAEEIAALPESSLLRAYRKFSPKTKSNKEYRAHVIELGAAMKKTKKSSGFKKKSMRLADDDWEPASDPFEDVGKALIEGSEDGRPSVIRFKNQGSSIPGVVKSGAKRPGNKRARVRNAYEDYNLASKPNFDTRNDMNGKIPLAMVRVDLGLGEEKQYWGFLHRVDYLSKEPGIAPKEKKAPLAQYGYGAYIFFIKNKNEDTLSLMAPPMFIHINTAILETKPNANGKFEIVDDVHDNITKVINGDLPSTEGRVKIDRGVVKEIVDFGSPAEWSSQAVTSDRTSLRKSITFLYNKLLENITYNAQGNTAVTDDLSRIAFERALSEYPSNQAIDRIILPSGKNEGAFSAYTGALSTADVPDIRPVRTSVFPNAVVVRSKTTRVDGSLQNTFVYSSGLSSWIAKTKGPAVTVAFELPLITRSRQRFGAPLQNPTLLSVLRSNSSDPDVSLGPILDYLGYPPEAYNALKSGFTMNIPMSAGAVQDDSAAQIAAQEAEQRRQQEQQEAEAQAARAAAEAAAVQAREEEERRERARLEAERKRIQEEAERRRQQEEAQRMSDEAARRQAEAEAAAARAEEERLRAEEAAARADEERSRAEEEKAARAAADAEARAQAEADAQAEAERIQAQQAAEIAAEERRQVKEAEERLRQAEKAERLAKSAADQQALNDARKKKRDATKDLNAAEQDADEAEKKATRLQQRYERAQRAEAIRAKKAAAEAKKQREAEIRQAVEQSRREREENLSRLIADAEETQRREYQRVADLEEPQPIPPRRPQPAGGSNVAPRIPSRPAPAPRVKPRRKPAVASAFKPTDRTFQLVSPARLGDLRRSYMDHYVTSYIGPDVLGATGLDLTFIASNGDKYVVAASMPGGGVIPPVYRFVPLAAGISERHGIYMLYIKPSSTLIPRDTPFNLTSQRQNGVLVPSKRNTGLNFSAGADLTTNAFYEGERYTVSGRINFEGVGVVTIDGDFQMPRVLYPSRPFELVTESGGRRVTLGFGLASSRDSQIRLLYVAFEGQPGGTGTGAFVPDEPPHPSVASSESLVF